MQEEQSDSIPPPSTTMGNNNEPAELSTSPWSTVRSASRSPSGRIRGSSVDKKRRTTIDSDHVTVATRTSSSHNSQTNSSSLRSSLTGGNLWSRLLQNESVWDDLNTDASEDGEGDDAAAAVPYEISTKKKKKCCSGNGPLSLFCLSTWYETKHFFSTMAHHPIIILASLAVVGLVAGVGMWAIGSERDAYVADKMRTAEFVARETGMYFANEFKRAFVPLYALREAVLHSGDFDHLAKDIGRYPNLLKEQNAEIAGGLANLRNLEGICDTEEILNKWDDLVSTSTRENDLDGLIWRYRLMPRNVACLEYKKGQANMDSGMDCSNSPHPFWKWVAEDLFIHHWKGLHVFGPFLAPNGDETFCTHLAMYNDPNNREWVDNGSLIMGNMIEDHTNIHGKEVANVWGFIMNYLNWGEMKKRSKIYERFANVDMDFELRRKEEGIDWSLAGPQGDPTLQYALLAKSDNSHLLDDSNSIVVETESLNGVWENRVGITSANGWNPSWWWPAVAGVVVVALLLGLLTAMTLVKSQLHRNLVKSMMPKKAAKKLLRGQTVIERFNLITVFYADVVDFSSVGHKSASQIMQVLNDLFTELDKIAKRHGVYKVETVGNRYMVVGGAPEQESANVAARRVALFALDAMAFVDNIFLTKDGDKVFIRAGLASNPAVAGCIGKSAPRYCFFGDAVDVASKMESTSKKNKIQCSEATYNLLQDSGMKFVMSKRREGVEIKGRGHQNTYWIERASPCVHCLDLHKGSYVLDPCGHVLCKDCNQKYNLNVCPTCRSKVENRIEWARESANKVVDIDEASFDMGDVEQGES